MKTDSNHKTQRARILAILLQAMGTWVPAPELAKHSLQFGARLYELRHELHFKIENRIEIVDGKKHSRYRLVPGAERQRALPLESKERPRPYPD